MTQSLTANLTLGKKLLLATFAAMTITAPIAFGVLTAPAVAIQPQSAGAPLPAYQVVTLKPVTSGEEMNRMEVQPNGFIATNTTVRRLIEFAYNIKGPQLSGGPSWIDSAHFDIEIKIEGNPTPQAGKLKILGGPQTQNVLKAVLADRFNLKLSQETKVLPVYDLVVSNTGSKLVAAPVPQPTVEINGKREAIISLRTLVNNGSGQLMLTSSLQTFADHLSGMLGTPVVDKTGLKGDYDITLHWNESPDGTPDVIAAVQEQLGLTLQKDHGPVTAFVIDNIETPSET